MTYKTTSRIALMVLLLPYLSNIMVAKSNQKGLYGDEETGIE